ncbi:hypothetical protein [Geoglobus ahangari]
MLNRLKSLFRKEGDWELIGSTSSGLGKVPKWVVKEMDRLGKKGVLKDVLYKNQVIILKGRRFEYMLVPMGQGVQSVDVYRRLRRRKKRR